MAVDGCRGEGERAWAAAAVRAVGGGFGAVGVLWVATEVRGEGGENAQAVVL